jgi:hypothetical protein
LVCVQHFGQNLAHANLLLANEDAGTIQRSGFNLAVTS